MEELFEDLIIQHGSFDIAEHEFRKLAYENPELREEYRIWCEENGYKERSGFMEYCHYYIQQQDERLDALNEDV